MAVLAPAVWDGSEDEDWDGEGGGGGCPCGYSAGQAPGALAIVGLAMHTRMPGAGPSATGHDPLSSGA